MPVFTHMDLKVTFYSSIIFEITKRGPNLLPSTKTNFLFWPNNNLQQVHMGERKNYFKAKAFLVNVNLFYNRLVKVKDFC